MGDASCAQHQGIVWTEGVTRVLEKVQWTFSAGNARSAGGALRLCGAPSVGERLDLGVGAKRPPHGGGPGAARLCRAK
ncbi:hypothetical protein SAMN04488005_0786 [Yoonia tamlensis]|uniref:Uncharacterized protein n=1 Tax=Yoonia tamlensis TaxID=390270 RepID=A0A1I6FZ68_9RHOB|nr:hypothetical protein SAMN04488005_0786 [Yoonia tamlensis]